MPALDGRAEIAKQYRACCFPVWPEADPCKPCFVEKRYHPSYFPTAYTRSSFAPSQWYSQKGRPVDVPFVVTKMTRVGHFGDIWL